MKLLPFFSSYVAISLLSPICFEVGAVKAFPGLLTYEQPDGERIPIRMVGSRGNYSFCTPDGLPLKLNPDGYYVVAEDASFIEEELSTESQMRERRRGPGQVETSYPTLGEQRALVILVEFADNEFSMPDPHDFYHRMLNEEGFSDNNGTGSARDYFIANSQGKFIPSFDVYGPVKLSGNIAYYGKNNQWKEDSNPQEMTIEACRLLDDQIDFSQYDRDGDGVIDNVFVYYAGYGEHDGGGSNTIWPHSTKLSLVYHQKFLFDGVELERYACSNELQSKMRSGKPDGIGTFCHEFGHVLGLPDLYSTSFINLETPGDWDLMDTGNYNNEGNTPANLSAFERYALDWMEPIQLDYGEYTLNAIGEANEAYMYVCPNPNEYFLFENRQQRGFDAYLPGHGMLVWRINYNKTIWDNNVVNNSFMYQYVEIMEADGQPGGGTRPGDTFPGSNNKTEFSRFTTPAFKGKTQADIPYALINIKESGDGVIAFEVADPSSASVATVVEGGPAGDCYYDLTGRKIDGISLPKGVYIHNGRKEIKK